MKAVFGALFCSVYIKFFNEMLFDFGLFPPASPSARLVGVDALFVLVAGLGMDWTVANGFRQGGLCGGGAGRVGGAGAGIGRVNNLRRLILKHPSVWLPPGQQQATEGAAAVLSISAGILWNHVYLFFVLSSCGCPARESGCGGSWP